jgi:hypothetical protein
LTAVCAVSAAGRLTAQTLSVFPTADTTISENNAARTSFDSPTLIVGRLSGNAGESLVRALLRFDLSQLPPMAVITSATLTVTVTRNHLGDSDAHSLHRVNLPWTEAGATWVTSGLEEWLGGDAEPFPDSTAALGTGTYVFPSTPAMIAAVRAWRSTPGQNHGWLLQSGDEITPGNARRIVSREGSSGAPVLTIRYAVPFDGPPPGLLANPRLANGRFQFQFTASPGGSYAVQASETVPSTNWTTTSQYPARGTQSVINVEQPVSASNRFFRVITTPAP